MLEKAHKRFKAAEKRNANFRETYEECTKYFTPQFNTFIDQTDGDDQRGQGRVYDSTGQDAYLKFISNLQSSLIPPGKKFMRLKPGHEIKEGRGEAAQILEEVREIMFAGLFNSNFDTQAAEALGDLAIGTGALRVDKGTPSNPFLFSAAPLSEIYVDEGSNSRVDAVFRCFALPLRAVQDTWKDAKMPAEWVETMKEKPEKRVKVVEAAIPMKVKVFSKALKKTVEVDGYKVLVFDKAGKNLLVERDQESNPWIIFRWSVRPGEVMGRGVCLNALADVKTINKTKELLLQSASMAVAGAYTVADDGIININNIRIRPGALIPVSANPGGVSGPTIAPLPRAGDINVAQLVLKDLKSSINSMMFADPLGPIDLPVKTATEVSFRQQELAKRIGSAFGRLQYEFITPLINRLLFILEDLDMIDLNQFRVDGRVIAIEHISPLSQAQDQEELIAIERYLALVVQTFGPEAALGMIKAEKMTPAIAELLNINPELVPSEEELVQMAQAMAQAQQQQQGQPPAQ